MVLVRDNKQNLVRCRALLDTCASANFVTEGLLRHLGIPMTKQSWTIKAINGTTTETRGIVQIEIQSTRDKFAKQLACLTIPTINDLIPSDTFPRQSIRIPANIKLADPEFHLPRPVDLLIGAGATLSLFCVGQINLSDGGPDLYLQKTRLGWIIAGSTVAQLESKMGTSYLTNLERQIERFWTIEEVARDKPKSSEEIACEMHFINTVSRGNDGRYIVRLPFNSTQKRLGGSRNRAHKRLLALERKLSTNAELMSEYTKVINEYLSLGHMTQVTDPDNSGYYMPHHAVIKETSNTTKLRVVFDASAKTDSGTSLNDVLMAGPTIQSTLVTHLIRFRTYRYVVTADVEKMYRQVWLHEDDRSYHQILWRKNGKIETFRLNTLTFGVTSSPFLAIRVLHKLAEDERQYHPKAAEVIKEHLYVDDLLTGAETIEEVRAIRDDVIALLSRGGFKIRQWAANDNRIINDLELDALHANIVLNIDQSLKTLGIAWDTKDDTIRYSARPIEFIERVTKRNILSEIAKIFDPMGLLGPVVLHAKKLMQDVWRCGIQWDESIPQSLHTEWSEFARQLQAINQVSFDRKLLSEECRDIQIHGFCDASTVGYGGCLYLRSVGKGGQVKVALMCAKSRVAPLKSHTIPRLELCGAALLAQLHHEVLNTLKFKISRSILWCDSTIVLQWVQTSPHQLRTFVANRVADIQRLTGTSEWRHVGTADNPADAISRGQLPHAFLVNQLWRTGPHWLSGGKDGWPNEPIQGVNVPELKQNTCLLASCRALEPWEKFSSYSKTLRIIAYCLRVNPKNRHSGPLSSVEINEAERRLLTLLQNTTFADEIRAINTKNLTSKNRLANLSPFIDSEGMLRVGGRLQGSLLTFSQIHPILLPSRQKLTDVIIRETHERNFHAGIQNTLCHLRQKFWVLDGRNQVRKIVRNCTRCFRFTANPLEYKMGNLPAARVRETTPFSNTGIDFCGPFFIKEKKHRNQKRLKVYVCVFVCLTIKAMHLELVSDLTTEGFLAALRRFTARRGIPTHVFSDNGTNFIGAKNELRELYALLNSDDHTKQVHKFASERRISWHLIPPAAPHFGGLWEASVKSYKHHFKRVIGDALFTFEELNTLTIEIEGILNSRPITSLSSDPNDMFVLTPAHYLIGRPLTSLPEESLSSVPANRLSVWRHISKVRQDFWARWNLEYLNELQTRSKWVKDGPGLLVGTIVLIKNKSMPCMQWALGRVVKLYPGADGVVRAAMVKTVTGELKRPVNQLCPLPIDQPTASQLVEKSAE